MALLVLILLLLLHLYIHFSCYTALIALLSLVVQPLLLFTWVAKCLCCLVNTAASAIIAHQRDVFITQLRERIQRMYL